MRTIEAEPAKPAPTSNSALRDWIRALEGTAPVAAHPERLLYHVVAELAEAQGDAAALIAAVGGERLTYRALIARANRYAGWALDHGLAKGDTVCLMMPNRPEYLAIWLGLSSAGIIVALINTELPGHSLAHCIDIVTPKHVIIAAECAGQFQSANAQLMSRPKVWLHGEADGGFERIDHAIELRSPDPPMPHQRHPVTIADRALLIYTSRRLGADPRPIFPAPLLGRRVRRRLHDVSIYRRAVPLSAQRAGAPARPGASLAALLRERIAGRHLEEISGPLRRAAHPGILRVHRRQCVALQR
jgi:hypothetical protein